MGADSRRYRFHQRIELEREILTQVNTSLTMVDPLAGLTEPTVLRWRDSLEPVLSRSEAEDVSSLIIELARRSSLNADCSRDVFAGEELVPSDSIGELLARLKDEIVNVAKHARAPSGITEDAEG
jgi:hypothetical protein